jgi:hypothetical protein
MASSCLHPGTDLIEHPSLNIKWLATKTFSPATATASFIMYVFHHLISSSLYYSAGRSRSRSPPDGKGDGKGEGKGWKRGRFSGGPPEGPPGGFGQGVALFARWL